MKKYLFLFLFVEFIINSCGPTKHKETENSDSTGIRPDTSWQSTADIVYDKLRFGMSEKDTKGLYNSGYTKIGIYEYRLIPRFDHNGKLYSLDILSAPTTADNIDGLIENEMDNLYDVILSKYGKEDAYYGDIDFFQLQPNKRVFKYKWELYTKVIRIGKAQVYDSGKYQAVLEIFDKNMAIAFSAHISKENIKKQNIGSDKF